MPYEVLHSRVAYDGRSRIRLDRVRTLDGGEVEREVVEQPGAVAVVPLDADDIVVLLRQYRHPLGDYVLEVPAGKLDVDGEAPADAARRELVEEVGLDAAEWQELVTFANSSGWTDEVTTVYLARDLRPADLPDGFTAEAEEADMQVVRQPLDELLAMARRGELTDAKTLVGVLLAGEHRRRPPVAPAS